mgnify:CR=1 FL=1
MVRDGPHPRSGYSLLVITMSPDHECDASERRGENGSGRLGLGDTVARDTIALVGACVVSGSGSGACVVVGAKLPMHDDHATIPGVGPGSSHPYDMDSLMDRNPFARTCPSYMDGYPAPSLLPG